MILKTFRSDDLRLKCLKISIAVKHKLCPRINVFTKLKKLSIYKTNSNSNNNSINNTLQNIIKCIEQNKIKNKKI